MKRKTRSESTKVLHPAKTRSTRALVLGNFFGCAWKHIQKLQKRKFVAFDRHILNYKPLCSPSSYIIRTNRICLIVAFHLRSGFFHHLQPAEARSVSNSVDAGIYSYSDVNYLQQTSKTGLKGADIPEMYYFMLGKGQDDW